MDESIEHLHSSENRRCLARATVQYFDALTAEALFEERWIAESLRDAAAGIDFDRNLMAEQSPS
jgi:hypothetical protein